MKKHNRKGVSLLLTLLIMTAIIAIAVGVSRLSVQEIKISRESPISMIAYYSAESGVEWAMYEDRVNGREIEDYSFTDVCIATDICYSGNASGASPNRIITVNGFYKNVVRAVELTY
jgi:Tfp pilus assembly protein PilX